MSEDDIVLERTNAQPLYVQARNILLARIENEEYKVNEKIPSESELCREFAISRMTVRAVLTELVRDGKLYRIQGKGTYVAEPKITAEVMSYVGIREQLEMQGYNVATELLGFETVSCSNTVAKIMGLEGNNRVYYIQRLRNVDGMPLSLHKSYIPIAMCPDLANNDFNSNQLCMILSEKYGLYRAKVVETLESVSANDEESMLLKIRKGHPLIRVSNTICDHNGKMFEYSTVVFRGDKLQIRLQYNSNI